jgi:hypothetical protein
MSGYDNNSYMTGSCEKLFPELTDIPKCEKCGYRTDYRYTNKNFVLHKKTLDVSCTYDIITIVSLKFKEFCIRSGYKNLVFIPLLKVPNFYQFYIDGNVLEYTAGTKEKYCNTCGQYESVVVPLINLEKISEPLKDGFYQSDLWFGSGNEKSPTIIIAPETKAKLDREKIKNICYHKIIKKFV